MNDQRSRLPIPALCALVLVLLTLPACKRPGEPGPGPEPGAGPGAPDSLLPLPEFSDCASEAHPALPAKWEATAVLQDFFHDVLVFGRFVYDEEARAFRSTLKDRYGTTLDLLVTEDRRLYWLSGLEGPLGCELIADPSPITVPSRDWLDPGAVCVGEAPILERQQNWWKTPSPPGANWIWFNTDNGLPFRTMYYAEAKPSEPVPVYEHFTFNYFPVFEEVASTDLPELLRMCENALPASEPLELDDATELFGAGSFPDPHPETVAAIQTWLPELSECESVQSLPPPWPAQVQGTVFMTAVSFKPNPFPTRVFYDWTRRAQNTTLYYYEPENPADHAQVALLIEDPVYGGTGYIRIEDERKHVSMCEQALPGPQVPVWKQVDGCECRAEIAPGTVLNPSEVPTKILWCPTDKSQRQVFWTWYSTEGEPVVFMQSNSSPTAGTGLNLADYYHWLPGSEAPPGTFDLPAACDGKPKKDVPPACHNCHLPTNS